MFEKFPSFPSSQVLPVFGEPLCRTSLNSLQNYVLYSLTQLTMYFGNIDLLHVDRCLQSVSVWRRFVY